jgi:hypothetical protein
MQFGFVVEDESHVMDLLSMQGLLCPRQPRTFLFFLICSSLDVDVELGSFLCQGNGVMRASTLRTHKDRPP